MLKKCGHCGGSLKRIPGIDGEALVTVIEATSYHAGECEQAILKAYPKAKITGQPRPGDL